MKRINQSEMIAVLQKKPLLWRLFNRAYKKNDCLEKQTQLLLLLLFFGWIAYGPSP